MSTSFQTSAGDNTVYVDGLVVNDVTASYWRVTKKAGSAFAGGTGNAHGDSAGTGNPYSLFTVTGIVEVAVIGFCNTLLAGATATLEVGITGNTAALIAQTTATDIDADEFWSDTAPSTAESWPTSKLIASDIIESTGTADITSGQVDYYCLWRPVSSDGAVVAA